MLFCYIQKIFCDICMRKKIAVLWLARYLGLSGLSVSWNKSKNINTPVEKKTKTNLLCVILFFILFLPYTNNVLCGFFPWSRKFYLLRNQHSFKNMLYVCMALCFVAACEVTFRLFVAFLNKKSSLFCGGGWIEADLISEHLAQS